MLMTHVHRFSLLIPAMCTIQSYVFLDLETTGIPNKEIGPTKITELSMVGVLKKHIETSDPSKLPRVLNKLTLCFHPQKHMSQGAAQVSGLSNELLEEQTSFDEKSFDLIDIFLSRMPGPICFIAHNGNRFDFPLLQAHAKFIGKEFPESIVCADSLPAFREIRVHEMNFTSESDTCKSSADRTEDPEARVKGVEVELVGVETLREIVGETNLSGIPIRTTEVAEGFEEDLTEEEILKASDMLEAMYAATPKQKQPDIILPPTPKRRESSETQVTPGVTPSSVKANGIKAKRKLFSSEPSSQPIRARRQLFPTDKPSYKLANIYKHVTGKFLKDAHSSEADTLALVQIASLVGAPFHHWVETNNKKFSSVQRSW